MKKYLPALFLILALAGSAHAADEATTVETPVVARVVERGAMLQQDDIEWAELPARKVRTNAIVREEEILGKVARHRLKVGDQFMRSSVERARIIERGGLISMIYNTKLMQLKDMGVAMENGSVGDIIRVKNEKSGKIVLAKVLANGEVVVNYEG